MLQNDSNADTDALSFPNFHLALDEGCFSCGRAERINLSSSIALHLDVWSFFHSTFTSKDSIYMFDIGLQDAQS